MRISVLIPTYNRQTDLLRAINSVLAQTVPVQEIIVIDDGSTDDTVKTIRNRFGSRIKLLLQKNQGVSAARNYGIREAREEWIAFLDSDDYWLPTKVERQLEALIGGGPEFGFCFTDNVFDGDPNLTVSKFVESGFEPLAKQGELREPAKVILAGREPFFTSSVMVRRKLLDEVNGFDQRFIIGEDTDLFFRLSFKTRFCFAAAPLVHIDRTPSRSVGLCNLYFTRDDRKYESLAGRFEKWLKMSELMGTEFVRPVQEMLRLVYYDSIECKVHEFRFAAALQAIARLRDLGESRKSVILKLFLRKVRKLQRWDRLPSQIRTIIRAAE